ncbi:MAG: tetratricopeptide repeat protein [Candidatus Acidiferrum sp.]
MTNELAQKSSGRKLDTWKEIAAFFGRDERTVKRWEKERGLPVHRLPGGRRGTVYAFSEELTAWLRSSQDFVSLEGPIRKEDSGVVAATESLPVRASTAPPWWRGYGIALTVMVLVLFGFARLFKLHEVQGRLLPSLSVRASSATHKQAEDLYLQGRYHWNKRTPADLTLALDLFTKSIQLEPNYALAYAGKADCYNLLREYTGMPPSQAFPLAIAAAKKSIALDDGLAEGHRSLAFALFFWEWDVPGAEREFQRAIDLNPKDVEAHHWYATMLVSLSRFPEAINEIEQARKLDPLSSSIAADRAIILYRSGNTDEAIAILQELKTAEPGFLSPARYLANIYFDRRDFEKYFDEAETAAKLTGDEHEVAVIQVLRKQFASGGEQAVLRSVLEDRLLDLQRGRGDALSVAESYADLGRNQEAIEYLNKAYERHDYPLIEMVNSKTFEKLFNEPEYQDIVKRVYAGEGSTT